MKTESLVHGPSFVVRPWSLVRPWSFVLGATLFVLFARSVFASDHIGRVTLPNGVPVPGARVTATQGSNTLVTTTDAQGGYRFAGIADGPWTMQVEMIGLSTQRRELTIAAGAVT